MRDQFLTRMNKSYGLGEYLLTDLSDDVRANTTGNESRVGRTRTCNQQIMSLLL